MKSLITLPWFWFAIATAFCRAGLNVKAARTSFFWALVSEIALYAISVYPILGLFFADEFWYGIVTVFICVITWAVVESLIDEYVKPKTIMVLRTLCLLALPCVIFATIYCMVTMSN